MNATDLYSRENAQPRTGKLLVVGALLLLLLLAGPFGRLEARSAEIYGQITFAPSSYEHTGWVLDLRSWHWTADRITAPEEQLWRKFFWKVQKPWADQDNLVNPQGLYDGYLHPLARTTSYDSLDEPDKRLEAIFTFRVW